MFLSLTEARHKMSLQPCWKTISCMKCFWSPFCKTNDFSILWCVWQGHNAIQLNCCRSKGFTLGHQDFSLVYRRWRKGSWVLISYFTRNIHEDQGCRQNSKALYAKLNITFTLGSEPTTPFETIKYIIRVVCYRCHGKLIQWLVCPSSLPELPEKQPH